MSKKKQPPDTEVPLVQKDGTKQPLTVEGTFAYYFECLCKARAGAYTSLCTADELKTVYETFCFHLKTALLYGFEPAACLVGYMYAHGLGCKKDMFKAALWIEIGAQLDNGIAKDLKNGVDSLKDMDDEHPGLLEMRELVSQARTLFTPEVVRAGAAYAAKVKGLNAGLDPEKTYIPNDFTASRHIYQYLMIIHIPRFTRKTCPIQLPSHTSNQSV